jgi:peptidoglycan/xylan/chitin deacetylase (PgdA/CDA1 family)
MFAGLTPEEEDALAQELRARCGVDLAGIADAVFMTWDMITAMDREGIVEIGAHSVSHRPLRGLTEEEARREMADSRARLQAHVRQQVAHFAYPFGGRAHASHREFRLACGAGFATAVTTRHGNVMPAHRYAPHALPRLSVHGRLQTLAALDLMLSGATSALANGFRRVVTV